MTPQISEIVRELERIGEWSDGGKAWDQNVWCAAAAQALTRLSERIVGGVTERALNEIANSWLALEEFGFPPEAIGWPEKDIGDQLPKAINSALDCVINQREDLLKRALAAEAKLAEIEDRRDHTEGGLQLLLAAAKAGDPLKEIIFRIEEELRQLRRPSPASVSGSTEGGNG